jgi:hypothetical protein
MSHVVENFWLKNGGILLVLSIETKISTTKHKQHYEIHFDLDPRMVTKW